MNEVMTGVLCGLVVKWVIYWDGIGKKDSEKDLI